MHFCSDEIMAILSCLPGLYFIRSLAYRYRLRLTNKIDNGIVNSWTHE